VVGAAGSGKEEMSILLARLQMPSSGRLTIGGDRLTEMPEAITGRRISYVGANAHMFSTSVRDNLYFGLKHRPLGAGDPQREDKSRRHHFVREAEASGNATDDADADWIDYAAAGTADATELTNRSFEVLRLVGMDGDLYDLGLRGTIDMATRNDLAEQFLKARAAFRERLSDPDIAALVETFDSERYNDNATLAENLLFGTPVGNGFNMDRLAENPYVVELLEKTGLIGELLDAGEQVASLMVELFADLPPGHQFFEQYSFISSDDLPEYQVILGRIGREGTDALSAEERTMLLSLPFRIVPARHRLDVISDDMKVRIMEARRAFSNDLPESLASAVEFFDAGRYNASASLQDNILFGKLAYGQARGVERVGALISEVVDALGLRHAVMEVGLDFQVGIGGARLSGSQRQRLAIARAVLKRPDILILNEATAALDSSSQAKLLEGLLDEFDGRGMVWALHRANLARFFDRVLVMRGGKIVEQGTYDALNKDGSELSELLEAE
jgi:ABC-type cobalamin/Fe3+-siderophores transport system ATPase subunit